MPSSQKVYLVTGANRGLGLATAVALAKLPKSTVILACRDTKKGLQAQDYVQQMTGNPSIEFLPLDLASLTSIHQAANLFFQKYTRLDLLINNAAVYKKERILTEDGFETMFATNHLGPFLLTNLLLPAIIKAINGRIITVSAASTLTPDMQNLQAEHTFQAARQFGVTKAENLLFAFGLARRLHDTRATSNVFFPGLVRSDLMNEVAAPIRFILRLISAAPENAAANLVYLGTAPELTTTSGTFWNGRNLAKAPATALNTTTQDALWEASAKLAKLK